MTVALSCSECGKEIPTPKNWTRLSIWRRELPRKCRQCGSTKHGMARSRLYKEWTSMRGRCDASSKNPAAIKYYVARGITVCTEWMVFEAFAAWAKVNNYSDRLTLDRIDNDKGYQPDNCRWVTMADNLRNRPDRKLTFEAVASIKTRRHAGESPASLSSAFGVTRAHIYRVCSGSQWCEA